MYKTYVKIGDGEAYSVSNSDIKALYKAGASIVRLGRRHDIRVRLTVSNMDGVRLLTFFGYKRDYTGGYSARLTNNGVYGKRCNGITY